MSSRLQQLTGREKAAILLITLGPQKSAEIFKHLNDEEIEELTLEIANIRMVSPEEKEKVLEDFYQLCLAQEYISEGGINYAKDVLERALGSQKAIDIINRLTASLQVRPFEFIRKADPNQLLNYIQNEHPQTIALILSYLKPSQAGQILSSLPQDKQAEVAKRIAIMDRTSPDIIKEIERVLENKFSNLVTQDYTSVGGIETIVSILNTVDRGTEKHIMEELETQDAELSEEIRRRMFVFEDIVTLDSRSIQRIIREIDNNQWAIALKSASEEVKQVIFANMSKRLAEMIKEDMEFMGPVRLKDIEEAQQNIVNVIRKLEEEGEIVTPRGGDEIVV
ncbi:flagellar motor switch protein FliG [Caloranaerobacter azorensis]|uniref:Flagellar motor switch protein FliG n=2 Tax=Caloranaerobacter azorensis TaxID=116090 RepID=A0A1M5RN24_9FIRM|nr:flagellar motor switch protein FliG [Caloranaerobacter azorensis]QIB26198.1 flagellar motor switch protein FliG [Caloranaerobacter azorensis]SHH27498.1 flagellar motor switch protein FliG [Caloranaerobacter azorensis DSM 13643]